MFCVPREGFDRKPFRPGLPGRPQRTSRGGGGERAGPPSLWGKPALSSRSSPGWVCAGMGARPRIAWRGCCPWRGLHGVRAATLSRRPRGGDREFGCVYTRSFSGITNGNCKARIDCPGPGSSFQSPASAQWYVWLGSPSVVPGPPAAGSSLRRPLPSPCRSADVGAQGLGCPQARAVSEAEGAVCEGPGGRRAAVGGRGLVGSGSDLHDCVLCCAVQRRRVARQEALDDDFSYARELHDRERRLRALEEQLERKAR